ncbi:MAG: hypothetical protein K9G34_06210, partial [Melioribacteraceae bacterium]|nr:hypothetical protein [Melioribacteraceae bacterium]
VHFLLCHAELGSASQAHHFLDSFKKIPKRVRDDMSFFCYVMLNSVQHLNLIISSIPSRRSRKEFGMTCPFFVMSC